MVRADKIAKSADGQANEPQVDTPHTPHDALPGWRDIDGVGLMCKARRLDVPSWRLGAQETTDHPGETLSSPTGILTRAAAYGGAQGLRHVVVGVIGPRDASDTQIALATELGRRLAQLKVTTVCGGRSGVMEAVCAGVAAEGGLSLGFLPGVSPYDANGFVGIPLPTGLSEGRNMVIARAARVLIAIGGSYGTLTEIAFGLHFGKTVIALDTVPDIEGLMRATTIDEAVNLAAAALLQSAIDAAIEPSPANPA
jgi:uncharacterized protein (TIGR00725 family)